MTDGSTVIFAKGAVTRTYNGVAVTVRSDRDITVADWIGPLQEFFREIERDKKGERSDDGKRNAPSRQARSA